MYSNKLLVVLLLCTYCSCTPLNLPLDYSKQNYGYFFKYYRQILTPADEYKHTFYVELPKIEAQPPLPRVPCTNSYQRMLLCSMLNTAIARAEQLRDITLVQLQKLLDDIMAPIPNVDTDHTTFEEYAARTGTDHPTPPPPPVKKRKKRDSDYNTDATGYYAPDFCTQSNDDDESQRRRKKRGVFDFVGKLITDVTGQPTFDDFAVENKHICEIGNLFKLQDKEIQTTTQQFTSASRKQNKEIDDVLGGLNSLHSSITELSDKMTDLESDQDAQLNDDERLLNISITASTLSIEVDTEIVFFQNELRTLNRLVDLFGVGIRSIIQGSLDPYIVPPDYIQKVIDHIIKNIIGTKGVELGMKSPEEYYYIHNIVSGYSKKTGLLYIMVKFPLVTTPSVMGVYRVIPMPFCVADNVKMSGFPRKGTFPDFFAVTEDGSRYTEMDATELNACLAPVNGAASGTLHCKSMKTQRDFTDMSCIAAVFKDDKVAIKAKCKYNIIHNDDLQHDVYRLTDDTFWIFTPDYDPEKDKDAEWTITCPLLPGQPTRSIKPDVCVNVRISCGCKLTGGSRELIPLVILDNCIENIVPGYPEVKITYPVSLPTLLHMIDVDLLTHIEGSTTSTDKWNVFLQQTEINKDNWDRSIERRRVDDLDFYKTIESMKNTTVVASSKEAALFAEIEDHTNLQLAPYKDMADSFSKFKNIIGTSEGFLSLGLGQYGLTAFLIIMVICVCVFPNAPLH